jgi:hypothetical protein
MASTPVYGITYPCSGDTIDAGVFQTFSDTLDAALETVRAELAQATNRPSAQIYQGGTVPIPIAVATDVTATFTTEVFDNDDMANLAVNNDRLTIQTGGVYWVSMTVQVSDFTTLTSVSAILQRNGVDFFRHKSRALSISADAFASFAMPADLDVGDTLIARARWTGTGGPGNIYIRRLTASLLVAH